jgi:hypothetical protein
MTDFDKKAELGAEEMVPVFLLLVPALSVRAVISFVQVKRSSPLKSCGMSDIHPCP